MTRRGIRRLLALAMAAVLIPVAGALAAGPAGATPVPPTIVPGVGEVLAPPSGAPATSLSVPFSLSRPSSQTVTVHWTTLYVPGAPSYPEPQAPPADYQAASGVATVAAGATTAAVTVTVDGDTSTTPEYVVVSFTDPTNANMGGYWGLGFGLIDPAGTSLMPTAQFDSLEYFAGGPYPDTETVTVTLDHPTARPVTVDWATADFGVIDLGIAGEIDPSPGPPQSGTVSFAPGAITATLTVTLVDPGPPVYKHGVYVGLSLSDPVDATLRANDDAIVLLSGGGG